MHYFFTSGKFTRPSAALVVVPRVLKPLIPFALNKPELLASTKYFPGRNLEIGVLLQKLS
jgi:hypothetical protein